MANVAEKRVVWLRWAVVFAFILVTSLLWANPTQMMFRSGPFAGRVVDADTGQPVPVAVLAYQWQGAFGQHSASSLTHSDGRYRLPWQGFGNWRIGAWPGPDVVYVQAPGYATGRFFLDGIHRDPYSDHDKNAKSASMSKGDIRLHRLRPNTKFNLVRSGIPFGIRERSEQLHVARRFYDELFPRLCQEPGKPPSWERTDYAFSQLYSIESVLEVSRLEMLEADRGILFINSNNTPTALDASTTIRLCDQLRLDN